MRLSEQTAQTLPRFAGATVADAYPSRGWERGALRILPFSPGVAAALRVTYCGRAWAWSVEAGDIRTPDYIREKGFARTMRGAQRAACDAYIAALGLRPLRVGDQCEVLCGLTWLRGKVVAVEGWRHLTSDTYLAVAVDAGPLYGIVTGKRLGREVRGVW